MRGGGFRASKKGFGVHFCIGNNLKKITVYLIGNVAFFQEYKTYFRYMRKISIQNIIGGLTI